jgi:hypothetical protein
MNPAFDEVPAAGSDAILSAFDTTALRLGTTSQNIEKDFWVCWTLDALFHGLKEGGPRLLFKGGTSLSSGAGKQKRPRRAVLSNSFPCGNLELAKGFAPWTPTVARLCLANSRTRLNETHRFAS